MDRRFHSNDGLRTLVMIASLSFACEPETLTQIGQDGGTPIVDSGVDGPNEPPVAIIDTGTRARTKDEVAVDSANSFDPDGTIASVRWTLTSTPAGSRASIRASDRAQTIFTPDLAGTYVVTLVVFDDEGLESSPTHATITVVDRVPPIASIAPIPRRIGPGTRVDLDGTTSRDLDGTIVAYAWTIRSGPASPAIVDPTAASAEVVLADIGTYVFALEVRDDDALTDTATASVRVDGPCSLSPSQDAIDFGAVVPEHTVRRGIRLANGGTGTCEVGDVVLLNGAPFSYAGLRTFEIEPGAWMNLEVEFAATASVTGARDTLRIGSNDPVDAELDIALTATTGCVGRLALASSPTGGSIPIDDDALVYIDGIEVFRDWGDGANAITVDVPAKGGDLVDVDFFDTVGSCRGHGEVWAIVDWDLPLLVDEVFDGGACDHLADPVTPFDTIHFEVPLGSCVKE